MMQESKTKLQKILIQERAERVETGLKDAYAADIPGDFSVFCVDNKSYKTNAMKGDKAIEHVRSSGIPKLRLFFNRISVQAQISELYSLASRLEELANSLLLWNDPSKRDLTHEVFEGKLKKLKKILVSHFGPYCTASAYICRVRQSTSSEPCLSIIWRANSALRFPVSILSLQL